MALPKKVLKEKLSLAGVADESMDELIKWILDSHTQSLDSLKEQLDEVNNNFEAYKKDAATKATDYDAITKERDKYKADFEKLQKTAGDAAKVQADFDAYKNDVETRAERERKSGVIRKELKNAGVKKDELIDLLMGKVDVNSVEFDGDAIKDTEALINPLKQSYSSLFGTVKTEGTPKTEPPTNGNSGITKEEIMNIKDFGKRQKAIAENLDLFR